MIELRNFKKEDKSALKILLKQLSGDDINIEANKLEADPNFIGIVIEDDGEVIGFGSISLFQSVVKNKTGVIEDVVVDEGYRGQGLGRKILQELEKRAREKDAKVITLTSNPSRIPAHKLYQSEGYNERDTGFYVKYL